MLRTNIRLTARIWILHCRLLLIEHNKPNHLNHRVKLVQGMSDVLFGQILGHIEDIQGESFLWPTWNCNLFVIDFDLNFKEILVGS